MKLPDFLEFAPFNQLRQRMRADHLGDFNLVISVESITRQEELQLENSGIEIQSLDSICELEDGTLAFKDSRVLLYIRDIDITSGRYSQNKMLPKFHVSWCTTLQTMKDNKRFDRYVLSTRTNGLFEVRKTGKYQSSTNVVTERLHVCKNCLHKLNYDEYKYGGHRSINDKAFNEFNLDSFFYKYPKSPLTSKPKPRYTSATAPTDAYADNFNEISRKYREKCGWKCEECDANLSQLHLRRYLHTHHITGRKDNDSDSNLKALCIVCHARLPDHETMKHTSDYKEYIKLNINHNQKNA